MKAFLHGEHGGLHTPCTRASKLAAGKLLGNTHTEVHALNLDKSRAPGLTEERCCHCPTQKEEGVPSWAPWGLPPQVTSAHPSARSPVLKGPAN